MYVDVGVDVDGNLVLVWLVGSNDSTIAAVLILFFVLHGQESLFCSYSSLTESILYATISLFLPRLLPNMIQYTSRKVLVVSYHMPLRLS